MDYSAIATKTYILKVNLNCSSCEKKVHKVLKKINGVQAIGIDGETGKVMITGNVDPSALIMALAKKGKKAEVLQFYHHTQPALPENDQKQKQSVQVPQHRPAQDAADPHLPAQMNQLHHLSNIERLKHVELTHSRSVKMTFKASGSDTTSHKCDMDDTHGQKSHHSSGHSSGPSQAHPTNQCSPQGVGVGPSRMASGTARTSCNMNHYVVGPPPSCSCIAPAPPPSCNHHVTKSSLPMAYPFPSPSFYYDHSDDCAIT